MNHTTMKHLHLGLLLIALLISVSSGQTATFDEPDNSTLRICSYNVMQNRVLEKKSRGDSFVRMLNGVKADIWMLQEMFYADRASKAELSAFRDHAANVTGHDDLQHAWGKPGLYLLSRYPIRWSGELHHRVHAAWIDLPPSVSSKDLVVINVHFKGSTPNQTKAAVNFVNQIKTGKHSAGIPSDVSFILAGDFNQTSGQKAFTTLVGSNGFVHANPFHIGTTSENKTIGSVALDRNANHTSIGNKQIDFVLHHSSVMKVVNRYVLNTLIMSDRDLSASRLRRSDVAIEPDKATDFTNVKINCDHFPIVVDYKAK
jgi:endonuclease/exonuclease/phosphatase family metal-dependent hydrolase